MKQIFAYTDPNLPTSGSYVEFLQAFDSEDGDFVFAVRNNKGQTNSIIVPQSIAHNLEKVLRAALRSEAEVQPVGLEEAVALINQHHTHHLEKGSIGLPDGRGGWIEIDNGAEYSDSGLFQMTEDYLHRQREKERIANIPQARKEAEMRFGSAAPLLSPQGVVISRDLADGALALSIGYGETYQERHQLPAVHEVHQEIIDGLTAALSQGEGA